MHRIRYFIRQQPQLMVYLSCALLTIICGYFSLFSSELLYRYHRVALEQGEWWRALTAHFIHTNHWHLLMNLAGLWLITCLMSRRVNWQGYLLLLLLLCLGQSLGLYLFFPSMIAYVGLSGALHGLLLFAALNDISHRDTTGYLIFAAVLGKLCYEQLSEPNQALELLIDARVAIEAHLVGAIVGGSLFMLFNGYRKLIKLIKP